jgi:hypothetical protein
MANTRRVFPVLIAAIVLFLGSFAGPALRARADLPARLSDQEFWRLTDELSEDNGFFRSDNFLSNETAYQTVIPDLVATVKPGGVYLGVGPEQNFPYILAVKPKMAFIIDIRRGNLHEQLLYKALFEMSDNRADFLSRLFSRKRPAGIGPSSSIQDLFAAYDEVQASEDLYKENLKAVTNWLTKKHEFKLSDEDIKGIDYVYHDAFFVGGPYLNYSFGSGGMGRGNQPTYEHLMMQDDGTGKNRGFLGTEEAFAYLKEFEAKNLLVPVVGNFGGPKAIRAVGRYVKDHGGTVTTFYLSNVEQYLNQDRLWENFCASVATLPLDDTSTYIYSGRGSPMSFGSLGRGGFGGGMQNSRLRPMLSEVKACAGG